MTVFTYRNFYGALRPVADVTIEANGTKFGTGMIIDSGADITMIPLRLPSGSLYTGAISKYHELIYHSVSFYGYKYARNYGVW